MNVAGKLENLKVEMRKNSVNILGVCEVRWADTGDFRSDGFRMIYSGHTTRQNGVGIILDQKTANSVEKIRYEGDRLLMVKLRAKPVNMLMIQVYMPTSDYDDEAVEDMYSRIEDLMKKESTGKEFVVIMGDCNAVVGEGRDGYEVGDYGLGQRNERGKRLIEFCQQNKYIITNTWYKHHKRRRYTWKHPDSISRYQLDYIMVKQRFRNSVHNAKAYPGADANSDHNLVAADIKVKLKVVGKAKSRGRWDTQNLKDGGVSFRNDLEKKLDGNWKREEDITNRWNTLKAAIHTTAEETVGYRRDKRIKKPWVTEEMLKKMEERRRWKCIGTTEGKHMYRKLNNELRRETTKAREKWWTEQCDEINNLYEKGQIDKMYATVKNLDRKPTAQSKAILDKEGKLLVDENDILERWKEYIEELYSTDRNNDMVVEEENEVPVDDKGPDLLAEEIIKALKSLTNGKAEGIDNIPGELLKEMGPVAQQCLIEICKDIYSTGIWPEDFTQAVIITLAKKQNATACSDFRTISLLSHASKVVIKVLQQRIEAKVATVGAIGVDQFGFMKGRGTREAIGSLRILAERSLEHGKQLHICFVDYEKAFDRVDWSILMTALKRIGVDWRDRRLIKNLYTDQRATVRLGNAYSPLCIIGRGTRQGCPLSPLLFNIYVDELMRRAMEGCQDGVLIGGRLVNAVRFADDQAMVADTKTGLQRIMDTLTVTAEEFGMKINTKKTKVMSISKTETTKLLIYSHGLENRLFVSGMRSCSKHPGAGLL